MPRTANTCEECSPLQRSGGILAGLFFLAIGTALLGLDIKLLFTTLDDETSLEPGEQQNLTHFISSTALLGFIACCSGMGILACCLAVLRCDTAADEGRVLLVQQPENTTPHAPGM